MLIVMSGVSGVGKNTVIKELLKRRKNLRFLMSATTRPAREGEECQHYFFTNEEFLTRKERGEFFETEEVHGFYYGMMMKDINLIATSDHDYIRDVDVHGNQKLRKYFAGKAKVLSIFLDAPDEELRKRLLGRGESEERVAVRLSRAALERACLENYDAVVQNINLDEAVMEIERLIKLKEAE